MFRLNLFFFFQITTQLQYTEDSEPVGASLNFNLTTGAVYTADFLKSGPGHMKISRRNAITML